MRLLRPVFQPVCRLQANGCREVIYFEALMRIDGDASGKIHTRLIPVAERCGFIGALDLEMLRTVLAVLNEAKSLRIGVNLSVDTVEFFVDEIVREIVASSPDVPRRLIVEITETHEPEDYEAVARSVQAIRQTGASLAMDDFGDGFADERLVGCIQPLYIKLAAKALDDEALLDRATLLAAEQGAHLIAEQINNEADVNYLISKGVEFGQGYLFGEPKSVIEYRRTEADRVSVFASQNKAAAA